MFRLICTLTIEKITADTALMLDRLGREAATDGRSGQCAIAAARLCRRIKACGSRGEVEVSGRRPRVRVPAPRHLHHAAERHWARLRGLFNRALAPH